MKDDDEDFERQMGVARAVMERDKRLLHELKEGDRLDCGEGHPRKFDPPAK